MCIQGGASPVMAVGALSETRVLKSSNKGEQTLKPRSLASSRADPIDVAVGERIRARRRLLGANQASLAAALGLSFQQVQKYEHGVNRVSASMLVRIAEILETTVAKLVGEPPSSAPSNDVLILVAEPDAQDLLSQYAELQSEHLRAAVLGLVRHLSAAA